jgi:nucleoside 2-deoxyribosyltransferase
MKPSVYLAGPITGLSYDGCTDWREYVKNLLSPDIDAFSPLRGKTYLLGRTTIQDSYEEHVMSTQRAILARDFYDCKVRDLIFVNLLGATKPSLGTTMEIAWAHGFQKPIVLVMEKNGANPHDHAMIREACPMWTDDLDEGIAITRKLLLP